MPDYKLEIEIDVAKFTRDINKGLNDSKFNFGQGGSGGTPKGGDVSAQWDDFKKIMEAFLKELEAQTKILKEMNSKTKRTMKQIDITYHADEKAILLKASVNRQYAILRASLVRDNMAFRQMGGLFSNIGKMVGGRAGGGIGRLIDTQLKYMQPPSEIKEFLGPGFAGGKTAVTKGGAPDKPAFSSGKAGGIPQMVKIAGFAAGLAGAAGLGKLIIDSSPLLQAMFKIVNVGIMFMLRPIGDMFALLIRPVSIIFLKYAAGFYKDTLKYFPAWDKFGQAIMLALTGHPGEALNAAGAGFKELDRIAWLEEQNRLARLPGELSEGGIVVTEAERKFIQEGNKARKEEIKEIMLGIRQRVRSRDAQFDMLEGRNMNELFGTAPPLINSESLQSFWDWITGVGDDTEAIDTHTDAVGLNLIALLGLSAAAQEASGAFHDIKLNETLSLNDDAKVGVNRFIELFEELKLQAGIDTTLVKGQTPEFLEIIERMKTSMGGGTGFHVSRAEATELNKIGTDLETQIKTMSLSPGQGFNFANQMFESGGGGQLPEFESFDKLKKHFEDMLISGKTTEEMSGAIADVWTAMESGDILEIQEAVKRMNNEFQLMSQNTKVGATQLYVGAQYVVATVAKMRSALRAFVRQSENDAAEKSVLNQLADVGFLNPDCNVVIDEGEGAIDKKHGVIIWEGPSNRRGRKIWEWSGYNSEREARDANWDAIQDYKDQGYSFESYAAGGFINEPVFGRGARTGKGYLFGESGPEKVSPVSGTGGTGGIQANFYISGVGGDDALSLERKLKPMVMKWLKEEGSRRGIL